MSHRTIPMLLLLAGLVAWSPAAADEASADGEFAATPEPVRFVRILLLDRPGLDGRLREEAYFLASDEGTLTLVGIASITYVDRDRDRQPDAGEVTSTRRLRPDAEADGPGRVDPDEFLARAAEAAARAARSGIPIDDLRVRIDG